MNARKLLFSGFSGPVGLAVLLASCAQVEPQADFDQARDLVLESTGRHAVFDPADPALTPGELDAILAGGLTLEEAQQLVLTNNRELQAEFQEIGVAHADWVQAQLLSNPSLDLLLRFPSGGGRSMLEATLGVELLELWRIPVRTRAARQDLEATVLRIARRAGERLADARKAYYAAVAAQELHTVAVESEKLAAVSLGAVEDLYAAGAADAFDENLARGPVLTAQLGLRTARIDASNAKRDLAKLLSIDRPVDGLILTDPLAAPSDAGVEPETLVRRALAARLDLRAVDVAVEALSARVRLEERKAWGDASAGPSVERPDGSGDELTGAAVSLTLPVFDRNHAQVARARFELEQLVKLREAARIAVAQDVRSSADRVNTAAAGLEFYSAELLPQAERSLALARESYAAGRTTLLALVEVQRQLLEARRGHVTLRLEVAESGADLERVVGAPLRAP